MDRSKEIGCKKYNLCKIVIIRDQNCVSQQTFDLFVKWRDLEAETATGLEYKLTCKTLIKKNKDHEHPCFIKQHKSAE